MDIAKRLAKIMQNQNGTLLFLKVQEPATGFAVIQKVATYVLAAMNDDDIISAIRTFAMNHITGFDGITVYRRAGRMIHATVTVFATQTEAESAARIVNVSHIVNLATKASIQVGDFEPNVPGDGDV